MSPVRDRVEHGGPDGPLRALAAVEELHGDDRVAVRDSGEALLDFRDGMRVTLFNNSETSVATQAAPDIPLIVHFVLWRGGLVGQKAFDDDRQVQIDTPSGAKVTVVGTIFFVTYDANTEITAVGNFEGTVGVVSGEQTREVPANTYVLIEPGAVPGSPQPLPLNDIEFAARARALNSPLAVIAELQEPALQEPTSRPTEEPTARPTERPTARPTARPTSLPTGTPTVTPVIATATFSMNANCRRGPGVIYEVLRVYNPSDRLLIVGRDSNATWWQLDAGAFVCWASDSVLQIENGHIVPEVAIPLPPTFTPTPPLPPTITPSPTPTITPSPTPTPSVTLCPPPSVSLRVSGSGPVNIFWTTAGGCEPFTGFLTGRYSDQESLFLELSVSGRDGSYADSPPTRCEGTFTIIYTISLSDGSGRGTSQSASTTITFIC